MSYGGSGYISPQQLTQPQVSTSQGNLKAGNGAKISRAKAPIQAVYYASPDFEPGRLTPGHTHDIIYYQHVSPGMMMSGHQINQECARLYILPRAREYSGEPSVRSITFSVGGTPAPYVYNILKKGTASMDGEQDPVFHRFGWNRTQYTVDVHGTPADVERINTVSGGKPYTRGNLALDVCARVFKLYPNTGQGVSWRTIRLVSFSYYRKNWVPVLAIDDE